MSSKELRFFFSYGRCNIYNCFATKSISLPMSYSFNWEVASQPERAFLRLLTCGGHMSCLWWNMSRIMYHYQFNSVTQSCATLCDPVNHSTPGLPVHHQLPESTQTHVHWVSDAIQPSHPLSSPSLLALNLSQHQGLFMSQLFTSGGQSIGVSAPVSVLPRTECGPLEKGMANHFSILAMRTLWTVCVLIGKIN